MCLPGCCSSRLSALARKMPLLSATALGRKRDVLHESRSRIRSTWQLYLLYPSVIITRSPVFSPSPCSSSSSSYLSPSCLQCICGPFWRISSGQSLIAVDNACRGSRVRLSIDAEGEKKRRRERNLQLRLRKQYLNKKDLCAPS